MSEEMGLWEKIKSCRAFTKLRAIKNIQLIAAIFIIAVALLIYSAVSTKRNALPPVVTAMDVEEERLSSILEGIDGAGRVDVMITREEDKIIGVLVVAEGAKDISVRVRLLNATVTALGVSRDVVDVYQMK